MLVSHEAESRDLASQETELNFLIQIALAETILRLRGAILALRETNFVSVETMLDSRGVCLALQEVVIGSQRALFVSIETCFQAVTRGALAKVIFTCAHAGDLSYPQKEVVQTSLGQSERPTSRQ